MQISIKILHKRPRLWKVREQKIQTSLASAFPEIAAEANGWDPSQVTPKSGQEREWKCPIGHIYQAKVYSRSNGTGCPVCAGKVVLSGFNDLQTLFPDVATWANGWDPSLVRPYSRKINQWRCPVDHRFEQSIAKQVRFNTCPICSHRRVEIGFNDVATTHPEIAKMILNPDSKTLMANSKTKVIFACDLGHQWEARLQEVTQGNRCPVCAGKKVLVGFNDLATVNPSLASEAYGWDPKASTSASGIKRKWKCHRGHIWEATVSNRSDSKQSGCPSCSKSGFDPNKDGFLYFIKHPDWEMLQIGITNFPDNRLSNHRQLGWELIEIRGPMEGYLTQKWESAILRMLKASGADLSNSKIAGKFDGYSEAWSKSTFQVSSITELMRQTEKFENE